MDLTHLFWVIWKQEQFVSKAHCKTCLGELTRLGLCVCKNMDADIP